MRLRKSTTSLVATAAIFGGGVSLASPASASVTPATCVPGNCPPVQNGCNGTSFVLYATNPDVGYCWNNFPGGVSILLNSVRELDANSYSGYVIANGREVDFTYRQVIQLNYAQVTYVALLSED